MGGACSCSCTDVRGDSTTAISNVVAKPPNRPLTPTFTSMVDIPAQVEAKKDPTVVVVVTKPTCLPTPIVKPGTPRKRSLALLLVKPRDSSLPPPPLPEQPNPVNLSPAARTMVVRQETPLVTLPLPSLIIVPDTIVSPLDNARQLRLVRPAPIVIVPLPLPPLPPPPPEAYCDDDDDSDDDDNGDDIGKSLRNWALATQRSWTNQDGAHLSVERTLLCMLQRIHANSIHAFGLTKSAAAAASPHMQTYKRFAARMRGRQPNGSASLALSLPLGLGSARVAPPIHHVNLRNKQAALPPIVAGHVMGGAILVRGDNG